MLTFHNISVRLGDRQILDGVSFSLRPHRLTALVGRNGSGKSTLLACVNQRVPYTGEILEGEKNLALLAPRERAKAVSILPQTLPAPHITAWEMASFGRNPYLDLTGRLAEKDRQAVTDALRDAGAEELVSRYVDTLSGGEKQRVALAMVLAQNTPIALLDEPTAHMDLSHEAAFLQMLTALKQRRKKTFLVVLHDLTVAALYADDFVVLDSGRLVFAGSKQECLDSGILEKTFCLKRYTVGNGERIFFSAGNGSGVPESLA
ncbi:MAG: ABC transporter ATP-binding protein [Faecousia sp.]